MNELRTRLRSSGMTVRQLAHAVNVREAYIHVVLTGRANGRKKQCSGPLAVKIEAATSGAVTRSMLRPDLWPPEPEKETTTSRGGAAE